MCKWVEEMVFFGGDEGVKWEKSGRVARGSGREKEREKD